MTHVQSPVHPDFPERGNRIIPLKLVQDCVTLGIQRTDYEKHKNGNLFRLKDLANFIIEGETGILQSTDVEEVRKTGGRIIHWVPEDDGVPVQLIMMDGRTAEGIAEPSLAQVEVGTFLQFERVGFARVIATGDTIQLSFAHK